MFANYFKIAYRNLIKNKIYTSINISSLAIGLTASIFLLIYIQDELSYDTHYNNYEQMYRIKTFANGVSDKRTQVPFGKTLDDEYYDISASRITRIYSLGLEINGKKISHNIDAADPSITRIFDLDFITGDKNSLDGKYSIIVSETIAKNFFDGKIGSTVKFGTQLFTVKGIFKNLPENSHIQFGFLFNHTNWNSMGEDPWEFYRPSTYLRLGPNLSLNDLNNRLKEFKDKYLKNRPLTPIDFNYVAEAVSDIHLSGIDGRDFGENNSYEKIITMSAISFMILLIACFNFMNLSTARAGKRAKEVGLRKTLGASKKELILQFLSESLIITLIAFSLAMLLVEAFLPIFNLYFDKSFETIGHFHTDVYFLFFALYLFVGLGAGLYPAFYLSKFNAIDVLKGISQANTKGILIRKTLVILQFSISSILVISSLVIINQSQYLKSKSLGYNNTGLYTIRLEDNLSSRQRAEAFRSQLLENKLISDVSLLRTQPNGFTYMDRFWLPNASEKNYYDIQSLHVDANFLQTYQITILKGRDFSKEFSTEAQSSVILNETAAKLFGFGEDPINKMIYTKFDNSKERFAFNKTDTEADKKIGMKVIGLIKDFHQTNPQSKIKPIILFLTPNEAPLRFIVFRSEKDIITEIELLAKSYYPDQELYFRSNDKEYSFSNLESDSYIIILFSFLGILLSCAGLFGLVSFTAEQKTKEIGIRKVLGASTFELLILFIKEYGIAILIANLLAFPIAYITMTDWLQNFPYHSTLTSIPFIVAFIFSLLITSITVSYQVFKSANDDPVEALRYE